jgi:hypothetical protein
MSRPINYDKSGRPTSIGEPPAARADSRIVCGARCTWWGSIYEVGHRGTDGGHKLPCCPHCGNMLFEYPNETEWFRAVDQYESQGHPGYRAMVEWSRGRCFKNFGAQVLAFARKEENAGRSFAWRDEKPK